VAIFCVLVFAFLLCCTSQAASADANAAKQMMIIRAAHFLDVRDGRLLDGQAILIEGDRGNY